MSATKEELEYAVRCSVEGMTELLIRAMLTKEELMELIEERLAELGYN